MTVTPTTARSNRLQWLVILLLAVLAGYAVAQMTGDHEHAAGQLSPEGHEGSTVESDGHESTTTSSSSAQPAPGSTCLLLTADEAAAALGTSVTAVEDARQCTYVGDDASGRLISVAKPTGLGGSSSDALGAGMEAIATAMEGERRDLPGIGDEAHGLVSSLLVEGVARKGEAHVAVVLVGATGSVDEQFASLADLLGKATARL